MKKTLLAFSLLGGLQVATAETTLSGGSGSWYDPAYNGSGFNIAEFSNGLYAYFYGYKGGKNGEAQWLLTESGIPTPIVKGKTYHIKLVSGFLGNGGSFTNKPTKPTAKSSGVSRWGTLNLTFNSCSAGVATLNGKDGQLTHNIVPLAGLSGISCREEKNTCSSATCSADSGTNISFTGTKQQKIFKEFMDIYNRYYALMYRKNINWAAVYNKNYAKITPTTSDKQLFQILGKIMTNVIKDGHTVLYYKGQEVSYLEPAHSETQQMVAEITDSKVQYLMGLNNNHFIAYGTLKSHPDIGYIKAKEFEPVQFSDEEFNQYKSNVDIALNALRNKKGIIIDVRTNLGGQLNYAAYLAGRFFADNSVTLQRKRYKVTRGNTLASVSNWVINEEQDFDGYKDNRSEEGSVSPTFSDHNNFSKTGAFQFTQKVAVLTSKSTASSAELFTVMMKSQKHVKTIGNTTFGIFSGSDNITLKSGNGHWKTNVATQDVEVMFNGKFQSLEGKGVPPDELILATQADLVKRKDVHIDKAIKFINTSAE